MRQDHADRLLDRRRYGSARDAHAELMILCARIGYNP
jgi:hypothetical protein